MLRNKCSSPLVNHVKHHTQGQLVRTQATTSLQGEDIEDTECMQGCARAAPGPASSAHPGFPEGAPLPGDPGQLGAVSPSPALEETRSSFRLVTWTRAGWADTAPPGTSPTPQLDWSLLSGPRNRKSHQCGSCVRREKRGGQWWIKQHWTVD